MGYHTPDTTILCSVSTAGPSQAQNCACAVASTILFRCAAVMLSESSADICVIFVPIMIVSLFSYSNATARFYFGPYPSRSLAQQSTRSPLGRWWSWVVSQKRLHSSHASNGLNKDPLVTLGLAIQYRHRALVGTRSIPE